MDDIPRSPVYHLLRFTEVEASDIATRKRIIIPHCTTPDLAEHLTVEEVRHLLDG